LIAGKGAEGLGDYLTPKFRLLSTIGFFTGLELAESLVEMCVYFFVGCLDAMLPGSPTIDGPTEGQGRTRVPAASTVSRRMEEGDVGIVD
jgi:hypothetical protein